MPYASPKTVDYAGRLCNACPLKAVCGAYLEKLPPKKRPVGVIAGGYVVIGDGGLREVHAYAREQMPSVVGLRAVNHRKAKEKAADRAVAEGVYAEARAAERARADAAPCGTPTAFNRHVTRREPLDDACRAYAVQTRPRCGTSAGGARHTVLAEPWCGACTDYSTKMRARSRSRAALRARTRAQQESREGAAG